MIPKKRDAKVPESKINKIKDEVGLKEVEGEKSKTPTEVNLSAQNFQAATNIGDNTKKSEKLDFFKWFLLGIILVFVVGMAWFGVSKLMDKPDLILPPGPTTGLAVLNPAENLQEDWRLIAARTNLASLDPQNRAMFLYQGVSDAANWEFRNGNDETLLVWVRIYPDRDTLLRNHTPFTTDFAWLTSTYLAFGGFGRMGAYRAEDAYPPLLFYVEENNNTMLYLTYYNTQGDKYNNTNQMDDQRFLGTIGRELYDKLDLYNSVDKDLNNSTAPVEKDEI